MVIIRYWRYLILILLSLFCSGGIIALQVSVLKERDNIITKEEYLKEANEKKVELELWKKIPSLGFNNLLADWTYLDFIQYYGDTKGRNLTSYSLSPDYFQIIVDQDPRFITAYFVLEPATTMFAAKPEKSVQLMAQGLQSIKPEQKLAYQVWFYKGIAELLFLADITSAIDSYEMTAKWAKQENTKQSLYTALRSEEIIQFLSKNIDSNKAKASAWLLVLSNAKDEQTRNIALTKLKELNAKVTINGNMLSIELPETD